MTAPKKRPQDHLPGREDTFGWTVDGETIELPPFKSLLTFGAARKLRHLDEADALFTVMEDKLSDDVLAKLDPMDADEMEKFFVAWQEHSGITMGESGASTASLRPTVKRSNTT